MTSRDPGRPHALSDGWFAVIVIAYLAIIKGVGHIASQVWPTTTLARLGGPLSRGIQRSVTDRYLRAV